MGAVGELDDPPRARCASPDTDSEVASRLVALAVERAQAGDRDALAFLYARFADDVCGYARSIVHDHHAAEDVTQQVFAKLIGVIGKYEQRDVPFFAWMLRVTRNVAVDHLAGSGPFPSRRSAAATQALSTQPRGSTSTRSRTRSQRCRTPSARCSSCVISPDSRRARSPSVRAGPRARSMACITAGVGR